MLVNERARANRRTARSRSHRDGHVRATLPDLVAFFAIPPPAEDVGSWRGPEGNHHMIHDLQVWDGRAAVCHALAHFRVVAVWFEAGRDAVLPGPIVTWDRVDHPRGPFRHSVFRNVGAVKRDFGTAVRRATPPPEGLLTDKRERDLAKAFFRQRAVGRRNCLLDADA